MLERSRTRPWRVIVADDDPSLRALLRFTIERDERFEVARQVSDGAEALEAVAAEPPDLLLLDIAMPVKDGLEVLADLGPSTDFAIVVLTGLDEENLEDAVLAAGADAYLEKGAAFGDLCDRLAQLLE